MMCHCIKTFNIACINGHLSIVYLLYIFARKLIFYLYDVYLFSLIVCSFNFIYEELKKI